VIGEFVVTFARLEAFVDLVLVKLTEPADGIGGLRERELGEKARTIRRNVETQWTKPQRKLVLEICEEVVELASKRNLILHGNWAWNVQRCEPGAVSFFQVGDAGLARIIVISEVRTLIPQVRSVSGKCITLLQMLGILPVP
jgi:hypothetical protein